MKRLLKAKADVDQVGTNGDGNTITALRAACFHGHVGAVRLLLKAKATVDVKSGEGEFFALYAARQGQLECARLLLEAKATVDLTAMDGATALIVAAEQGDAPAPTSRRLLGVQAAARARDAEAFKGGMTVKEINAAFGERAGELKKPAKRVGLIDMGLIHLFMM